MSGMFYHASGRIQSDAAAIQASASARRAANANRLIEADVEKLLMITEALWTIMKEEHGYTDDELMERIRQIDLRDGKLDGKVKSSPPQECPECGRTLIGDRPVCLYCGAEVQRDVFDR